MAGNTKYVKIPGKASWHHIYKPDDYANAETYKFSLVVNQATKELIQKYDLQGEFKQHESGDEVYTFRRPAEKVILKKFVSFAPPTIYNKDGSVLCAYKYNGEVVQSVDQSVSWDKFEPTGEQPLIGHGSDVVLDVCVYDTFKGKGARLQSVKLIDLIEYVPQSDVPEAQTPVAAPVAGEGAKAPW